MKQLLNKPIGDLDISVKGELDRYITNKPSAYHTIVVEENERHHCYKLARGNLSLT